MIRKILGLIRTPVVIIPMIAIAVTVTLAIVGLGTHHAYATSYESCPDGYHFNDVYNTCVIN